MSHTAANKKEKKNCGDLILIRMLFYSVCYKMFCIKYRGYNYLYQYIDVYFVITSQCCKFAYP